MAASAPASVGVDTTAVYIALAIGLFLLMVLIATLMMFYLDHFQESLGKFIVG